MSSAQADQFGDLTYTSDGSVVTITGYTGSGGAVTIPAVINDLPVTTIAPHALAETLVTSVTIPAGVTNIGPAPFGSCWQLLAITVDAANPAYTSSDGVLFDKHETRLIQCPGGKTGDYLIPSSVRNIETGAFDYCANLTNVTIPGSVTNIGDFAFFECEKLPGITIPDSVTRIGFEAFILCGLRNVSVPAGVSSIGNALFAECADLTIISVDPRNAFYTSVDGVLFDKHMRTLMQYPCAKSGPYAIPDGVTNIETTAFQWCVFLDSVAIPDGVTRIGAFAFDTTYLTSVTIPASVTYIGDHAFHYMYGYEGLEAVYFKGNAPSIDSTPIDSTSATVYYLPGTTGWGPTFSGCPTKLWVLPNPVVLNNGSSFGVGPKGFGFTISWATNRSVVVETATNLADAPWIPLQTLNLTNGATRFSDPNWRDFPARYYRIRSN